MALEGTLRVNPETMISIAGQFGTSNTTVTNLIKQMIDIANTLSSTWQSPAATQYYSKLKGLESDMNRISAMIKEHADDLQQMGQLYQQAEKDNASTASSLPTTGLP